MLPDILQPNLKIVFCGTAAGAVSASRQEYYAGPGNKFYSILFRTGLTDRLLEPNECESLLNYGIGLTDVVKSQSGNDDVLKKESFDVEGFIDKIVKYKPDIIAFNGKKSASYVLGHNGRTANVDYGIQNTEIGSTRLIVLPSTSGSANGFWDEKYWFELAKILNAHIMKNERDSFIIPSSGNSITENDIEKGYLRITADFKEHFPNSDRTVKVGINNKQWPVNFKYKDQRSHLLQLGIECMNHLKIEAGDKLKVTISGPFQYEIKKIK